MRAENQKPVLRPFEFICNIILWSLNWLLYVAGIYIVAYALEMRTGLLPGLLGRKVNLAVEWLIWLHKCVKFTLVRKKGIVRCVIEQQV